MEGKRRCSEGMSQGGRGRIRREMSGVIVLFCCCDKNRNQEQLVEEGLVGFMVPDLC